MELWNSWLRMASDMKELTRLPHTTSSFLLSGVLLSGGLDSSLVAAIANRAISKDNASTVWGKLHSFCIGLPGSPDLAVGGWVGGL
jgi:asparagine synthase (glutamine-hydrolysing)